MGRGLSDISHELSARRNSLPLRDLVALVVAAGCEVVRTKEGIRVVHPTVQGFVATVAKPHGKKAGNCVRSPYVKQCVTLLERVRDEQEGNHGSPES